MIRKPAHRLFTQFRLDDSLDGFPASSRRVLPISAVDEGRERLESGVAPPRRVSR